MTLPAREQVKLIYDLLKAKVKFKGNGGPTVKCEDGRIFYKTHYDAAKSVIKIQREKRRNPYGTRDSEKAVRRGPSTSNDDRPDGVEPSSAPGPAEAT